MRHKIISPFHSGRAQNIHILHGNTQSTEADGATRVAQLMAEGLSRKDDIKQTAKELNLPKNVVYDAALK